MMHYWYKGEPLTAQPGVSRWNSPLDLLSPVAHWASLTAEQTDRGVYYHVTPTKQANSLASTYKWVDPDPLIEAMLVQQFSLKSTTVT